MSKTVAISGGFDPLHVGHIRYIKEAKKLGDWLIVILNGDDFLIEKKGYCCLSAEDRREILKAIDGVDEVCIYDAPPGDMTVIAALKVIQPDIFAKGGDRRPDGVPIPEEAICKELGIEIVYGVGGNDKPDSSSWIIDRVIEAKMAKECRDRLVAMGEEGPGGGN